MGTISLIPTFFGWWYSRGIKILFTYLEAQIGYFGRSFSLGAILKTFFSPWKRMVKARAPGIDGLKDWLLDNLVSRVVAMVMRACLIIAFSLMFVLIVIFAGVAIVLWITLPIALFIPIIYVMIF